MSKSFSQDFDDEICAIMRLRENKAFLGLEMKETKSILYKCGINVMVVVSTTYNNLHYV